MVEPWSLVPSCKDSAACSSTLFLPANKRLCSASCLQVLRDRLPFDEVALLQENSEFITRCGPQESRLVRLPRVLQARRLILHAVFGGCSTISGNPSSCSPASPSHPMSQGAGHCQPCSACRQLRAAANSGECADCRRNAWQPCHSV